MIFNSNTTSLSTVAMAEGYDCSTGVALALIESARSEAEMFKAMLNIDAKELSLKESAEITALNEAAAGGIFKKIAELLKRLAAKVKAILHNFAARLNGLFMKDKDLIKKYQNELLRKKNLDKLEVKWVKDYADVSANIEKIKGLAEGTVPVSSEGHADSLEGRLNYWSDKLFGCKFEDVDDIEAPEAEDVKLSELGGIRKIMNDLEAVSKEMGKVSGYADKYANKLAKAASDADKKANDTVKADSNDKDAIDDANKAYEMATAFQTVSLKALAADQAKVKAGYKQLKVAFMKAVTVSEKKLEESAYLNAIAEEAEQEVEDVIAGAIDADCAKCGVQSVSTASLDVKDADVKDDAELNVYDKVQSYSDECDDGSVDGSIDTNIDSKEEAAFFGTLFY